MSKRKLSDHELKHAQEVAAATFLSAYIRRMSRAIGVETESDTDVAGLNAMALECVEVLNTAMSAAWCALMKDDAGMAKGMQDFNEALKEVRRDRV
jgi:hypothetical protein